LFTSNIAIQIVENDGRGEEYTELPTESIVVQVKKTNPTTVLATKDKICFHPIKIELVD
jgi:hypothetical protein